MRVLDKRPVIGIRPIRCGEAFGPAADWPLEIPFDLNWVESEIGSIIVESPANTQYSIVRPGLGWAVDRTALERKLAERASVGGARLQLDCCAIAANFDKRWTVLCMESGRQTRYTSRFLVGADGVESRVALWAGIHPKRKPAELCTTAQVHYHLRGYERNALYFFVGPRFAKHGYAWIFPGVEGKHNIGVGVLASADRQRMDHLLRAFLAQKGLTVPESEPIVYGAIPVNGFDRKLAGKASLLVGDAAAMAYPLSAGGILNALHAALLAAPAIGRWLQGERSGLSTYSKNFRRRFGWGFRRELWARKILFACNDKETEELFQRTRKALPKHKGTLSEARAVLGLLKAGVPFLARKMLFGLLVLISTVRLQAAPTPQQISALQAALSAGERQEYDSSFALFNTYLARNPRDPLALLLKASITGLRMLDFEDTSPGASFESELARIISLTDSAGARPDCDSAWVFYVRGAARATLASHQLRKGKYWKGSRIGMDALDAFDVAARRNPPMADCFLYQGLYDYVKGELERKLRVILFWREAGGKAEGIRKLEICREHALFSNAAAAQTLLGIYVREKDWDRAEALYRDLVARLPANRPARWTLANGYFENRQWSKAAVLYGDLRPLLTGVPGLAKWQIALCSYKLAACAFETGAQQEARTFCGLALESAGPDEQGKAVTKNAKRLLKKLGG